MLFPYILGFSAECMVARGFLVEKPCAAFSDGVCGMCRHRISPWTIAPSWWLFWCAGWLLVASAVVVSLAVSSLWWLYGHLVVWVSGLVVVICCNCGFFLYFTFCIHRPAVSLSASPKKDVWKSNIVFVLGNNSKGNIGFIGHGSGTRIATFHVLIFFNVNYLWIHSILLSSFLFLPSMSDLADLAI
uniref:Uncharacterized protein n=1 Tax=Setaria viridis TaxID=4556 RepID=A0A4U6WD28_SETVI|nr:hypothetical protein SEVIR_1G245550v2 [Setaria viridis]